LRALILGKGVSGRGAGELLTTLGFSVSYYQDGEEFPDGLPVDFAVKSPGFPPDHPAVLRLKDLKVPLYGEVELAYRFTRGRIVGITGTNGKSTTTALVYHSLKTAGREAFIGGNYGIPASSFALSTTKGSTSVLELSSFQIEDLTSFRGEVGAVLNVTPDHLNRYRTFDDYAAAKLKTLEYFDFTLLNRDDPILSRVNRPGVLFFGRQKGGDFYACDGYLCCSSSGAKIPLEELPLKGVHNEENYLCALGILTLLGLSEEEIYRGFRSFTGLPHRTETVATVGGVTFVNDSKSTNVDSLKKALLSFKEAVLIAGGSDKGLDFSPLLPIIKERVRAIVAIGETAETFRKTFSPVVPVEVAPTLEEAVFRAFEIARPEGSTVLLSPGCASFDMFRNYQERGEAFKRAVRKLEETLE